jgi:4-amino-4-deoxychorismate lyase
MLINGVPGDQISIHDRGLSYGDGVFRTILVHSGQALNWKHHAARLSHDCLALNIPCPAETMLHDELEQLIAQHGDGIAKIIVTRGVGRRGYAPSNEMNPTRILSISPLPVYPEHYTTQGIKVRVCNLRLSHQPALAGIKHLNRLENVLAAAETDDPDFAEGLLLDIAGNAIEGIRTNLFMVRDGILLTPDLSFCGVAGVQRERVMEWARIHRIPCKIINFGLAELLAADEVFLVNSIIGLWKVKELQNLHWPQHPMATQLQEWLKHAPN